MPCTMVLAAVLIESGDVVSRVMAHMERAPSSVAAAAIAVVRMSGELDDGDASPLQLHQPSPLQPRPCKPQALGTHLAKGGGGGGGAQRKARSSHFLW